MHGADGQQASALRHAFQQGLLGVFATVEVGDPHLHPVAGQGFPDDAIGREFQMRDHHVIAGLPVETMGHHRQGLGGVLEQGDLVRGAGIDQLSHGLAQFPLCGQPACIVAGTEAAVFLGKGLYSPGGARRPGGHGGMVQIAEIRVEGEFSGEHAGRSMAASVNGYGMRS